MRIRASFFLCVVCLAFFSPVGAAARPFALFEKGAAAKIVVDEADWKGVARAAGDLADDIGRVTGTKAEVSFSGNGERGAKSIVVGTIGKSRPIDGLVAAGKLDVREVAGRWESSVIQIVDGNLVVAGADKRGTIFAVYEISKRIGVSPWHWWADVPVRRRDVLTWGVPRLVQPSPKVKYRGIFINDEWPSFGGWTHGKFGGFKSPMYTKMFELLLRLKANYLWPAMWSGAFNEDDPENPRLADEYGIVMGTSHHEPMMRAHKEYVHRREEVGPWNYETNKERIDAFFRFGLARNKAYENLVTIGMRGDGDEAMANDDAAAMATLRKVVEGQRRIIADIYGAPDAVPQLWAIFTEVQRYYDAGFDVPDDVTLLFCDNNWGYIRRLAPKTPRKGGYGLYYHIDMNGGPWNDRWVNTTTIPKLREQLSLAYKSGLDRIWIVNVGDLKPKEVPIDFILSYAWDPDAVQPGDEAKWLRGWSASVFGKDAASEVADIIAKYSKYNLLRKPEVNYPGVFSVANYGEAERMLKAWRTVAAKAEALKAKIPDAAQDAYFQLVYYPAVASAGVAEIHLAAASGDEKRMHELFERDRELADHYNKVLSGGKWKGMMGDVHIGYENWSMPKENVLPPASSVPRSPSPDSTAIALAAAVPRSAEYSICALDSVRNIPGKGAKWIPFPDLGRGRGCMGASDTTVRESGARLEYAVETTDGRARFAIGILPTQDVVPERGLRLGVALDGGAVRAIDARQGLHDEFGEYTKSNLARSKKLKPLPPPNKLALARGDGDRRRDEVFDNIRWLEVVFENASDGKHTLSLVMIDPEIVVERIVVNPDDNVRSYLGPPPKLSAE